MKLPSNKMKDYRSRLRGQGLRPVQIWIPDRRLPNFEVELGRQVAALDAADEADALTFIEKVAEDGAHGHETR